MNHNSFVSKPIAKLLRKDRFLPPPHLKNVNTTKHHTKKKEADQKSHLVSLFVVSEIYVNFDKLLSIGWVDENAIFTGGEGGGMIFGFAGKDVDIGILDGSCVGVSHIGGFSSEIYHYHYFVSLSLA